MSFVIEVRQCGDVIMLDLAGQLTIGEQIRIGERSVKAGNNSAKRAATAEQKGWMRIQPPMSE